MSDTLPRPEIDSDGLLEYSVVYTDRALNHMSQKFQTALRYISATLKSVYRAQHVAVIPGSGTTGMEAVARQFARGEKCLIIRNGFFSYRWTQIIEQGRITGDTKVLTARQADAYQAPFAPAPIDEVCAEIAAYRPAVVFAPHVETASGIMLPDDYIARLAEAVHAVGGLLVIDCIASGCIWLDMEKLGIDVLISAPQKGWSGTPCAGLVMLNGRTYQKAQETQSDSFAADLKKWLQIMEAFENGGHAYHATMPTDGLFRLYEVMKEAESVGFENCAACKTNWAAKSAAYWPKTASRVWPPKASKPRAWWFPTPTIPTSKAARPLSNKACKPLRACRCKWANAAISKPSAWACSVSTSCKTSTAPSNRLPRYWQK